MTEEAKLSEQARGADYHTLHEHPSSTLDLLSALADAVERLTAERDEARKWANTMEHERDWERDVVQTYLIARAEAAEADRDQLAAALEEIVRREGFTFTSWDYAALAREALAAVEES